MATIRLINTTTRLPVDTALETGFFQLLDPGFAAEVREHVSRDHVDVHFVGAQDEHLLPADPRLEVQSIDYLGVYVPHDRQTHRALIKVCPERVMEVCLTGPAAAWMTPQREWSYVTLLGAVVIHELAHALMDPKSHKTHCQTVPWHAYVNPPVEYRQPIESEDNPFATPASEQAHYSNQCTAWFHKLQVNAVSHGQHFPDEANVQAWRATVEESLATAIMLNQRLTDREAQVLRAWTALQPPNYQAGRKWTGTLRQLLRSARSWRSYQATHIESGDRHVMKAVSPDALLRLKELVDRLTSVEGTVASFEQRGLRRVQEGL